MLSRYCLNCCSEDFFRWHNQYIRVKEQHSIPNGAVLLHFTDGQEVIDLSHNRECSANPALLRAPGLLLLPVHSMTKRLAVGSVAWRRGI